MRTKAPMPSDAQAKAIAEIWATGREPTVSVYVDPTTKALIRNGWLAPTTVTGHYPNGAEYTKHSLSEAAVAALEGYLWHRRMRQK